MYLCPNNLATIGGKNTHVSKDKNTVFILFLGDQLLTNRAGVRVVHCTTSQTWNQIGHCHPHFLVHIDFAQHLLYITVNSKYL